MTLNSTNALLISTWNGEGYTDSTAELITGESMEELMAKFHEEFTDNANDEAEYNPSLYYETIDGQQVLILEEFYSIGADDGRVTLVLLGNLTPPAGVILEPDCNHFRIIWRAQDYTVLHAELAMKCNDVAAAKNASEAEEIISWGSFHTDEGCMLPKLLTNASCHKCDKPVNDDDGICPHCLEAL